MAKKEHVDILKLGVDVWNDWRAENRYEEVDLSEADLRGRNLSRANLWRVNLAGANLSDVNLYKTDFFRANLSQSLLNRAMLRQSDLRKADLSDADLSEAILVAANMLSAILTNANLQYADLEAISFGNTVFGNTNLKDSKHLELCQHKAYSIIDQMTLVKSGPLSKDFLRGCGLADKFIELIPSLFWKPESEEFYSCFISYSHKDKQFAQSLYHALQEVGIRCWLDEKQLLPGDDIHEEVARGIGNWDKVLLCCSENSLSESWWVDNEITLAFQKEQQLQRDRGKKVFVLIPINLDDYIFRWNDGKKAQITSRVLADFTEWATNNDAWKQEIGKITRALRADRGSWEIPPEPKI